MSWKKGKELQCGVEFLYKAAFYWGISINREQRNYIPGIIKHLQLLLKKKIVLFKIMIMEPSRGS